MNNTILRRLMQRPAELLQQHLDKHNLTLQEFSQLSGMPVNEVKGIIEGELPVTTLRANHLAAVFDTDPDMWVSPSETTAA